MSPARHEYRVREIEPPGAPAVLRALEGRPGAFLLHSAQAEPRGRWSFFGADPVDVFGPDRYDEAIRAWRDARPAGASRDPSLPPFAGGLVGAWAYDFGRRFERMPAIARDDLGWPDAHLAAYDVTGAIDHRTNRAWLVATTHAHGEAARAGLRLDAMTRRLEKAIGAVQAVETGRRDPPAAPRPARSTFDAPEYREAVERIREHIRRGDLFQANLSQRWTVSADGEPARTARALFAAMTDHSPAPFAAFLDLGERAVASASPERFLEVRGDRVETRPIKGTRPRRADPDADAAERAALVASAKDRAENVMIVDLLRNDLSKNCASVKVPRLFEVETYATVHHLVSTVTGVLKPGRDALDLLRGSFPGGSITGAPKLRAMQIIDELEPHRRGVYCGAIGYIGFEGNMDLNIAIRTLVHSRGEIRCWAGGGIVADSRAADEYQETFDKAAALLQLLQQSSTAQYGS